LNAGSGAWNAGKDAPRRSTLIAAVFIANGV
jgi:hypothetical protein